MVVSAARATTLASSVLPEPGGPSAKTGFCIWAARKITLSVTGSVTYLAASSFSDNSRIEENTRRGSLKPHAKAESFGGLLNFSVFRQACPVTGSPEDLPIQRRTMSSVHFHGGTTFPHSLCFGRGPGVRLRQRCDTFFEATTFPHAARPSPFAERQPGKSGSQGDRGTL